MRLASVPVRSSWTWWWSFSLFIAAPALVLALLGLRAVRAERIEREQRLREQQTQIAHLADAAIANALAGLEGELRRAETGAQERTDEPERALSDLPVFSFDRRGLLTFNRERVYFGEVGGQPALRMSSTEWSLTTEQLIEQAQAAEAQARPQEAVTIYRRIMRAEPKLRPWADFSIARIQHQRGNAPSLALLSNPNWSRSEGTTPTGLPVALIACASVERVSSRERTRFVPLLEQTIESLRAGRWWLSYDQWRFYDAGLRRLLESAGSSRHFSEETRFDELAAIEQIVRQSPLSRRDAITRSFERGPRGAFLIIYSPSSREPDLWLGMAISERRLANLLDATMAPLFSGQPFSAALRDAHGNIVWGKLPNHSDVFHTEGLRAVSGWALAFSGSNDVGWRDQKRLLWYGFILLPLVVLMVGLAMTVRVVRREAELGRLQNEFVAAVTHEFKSPVTSIRLLLERLASGRLRTPEAAGEYYGAISREMDRLERHVNRLLEAQQIQAGRKQYNFAPTSITEIAEIAVKQVQSQAEARRIGLEVKADENIPNVLLDKAVITDALQNLLDNAVKYSPSGTRVTVVIRVVDHQVCVDVCDQGIGIAPDDLPRIFDKFYRGRRGNEHNVHGTGLGLVLVKVAVEAHGGTVEVTSAPGQGSCFSLRLPTKMNDERGRMNDE